MTSRLETSRYRDFSQFLESIGLGLENFGLEKKSQYRSRKYLVSKKVSVSVSKILVSKKVSVSVSKIFALKKSLGISLENLGLKIVSVSVSKIWVSKKFQYQSRIWVSKSLSIGLERFGLKKSLCNGLKKVLVFHIFQNRK